MAKSLLIAYALWATGGLFGVHHFYLKRDKQAFIWWTTFGGWWLGWLRDFFTLPRYVDEYNSDESSDPETQPSTLNWERLIGAVALGTFYGTLMRVTIPEDIVNADWKWELLVRLLVPLAIAIGVYLVMNIGREEAKFKSALQGAYILSPITMFTEEKYIFYMAIASVIKVRYDGVQVKRGRRRRKSLRRRCTVLGLAGLVYLAMWSSVLLFNVRIHTETGDEIPLRTAVHNFFHSQMYRDMGANLRFLYNYVWEHGWEDTFNEMKRRTDASGIEHAHEVLGVSSSASEQEIKQNYKQLSRKYHPDKYLDEQEKLVAHERFLEIQKAYETISNQKLRREMRNRRKRD